MRLFAGEEIVDDANALPIAQQSLSDVGADEAGGAGDDVGLRHGIPRLRLAPDCRRAVKLRKVSVIMIAQRARCPASGGSDMAEKRVDKEIERQKPDIRERYPKAVSFISWRPASPRTR